MLLDLSSVSGVIVVGALLSFPARVNSVWRVAFNWSTSASFGRGDQVDGLPRHYNVVNWQTEFATIARGVGAKLAKLAPY